MAGLTPDAVRQAAADWFARLRAPDGEGDRAAFEAWCAADPRHRTAYDRLAECWDQAALLGQTVTGQQRQLTWQAPFLARRGVQLALAAALVAILGAAALFIAPDTFGFRVLGGAPMTTRVGEIRSIALTDGSRVTLDTDTEVATRYTAAERQLELLHGRARFTVAHDAARPFRVVVAGTIVTAHGTIFDVSLTGGTVAVVLLRGSVDVRPAAAQGVDVGPRRLKPGEAVLVEKGMGGVRPAPAPREADRWTSGMLDFDNTPLGDVIAVANRYGTTKIRLSDPGLADLRVTGAYRAADTAGLAASLAAILELEIQTSAGGDIVLRARTR